MALASLLVATSFAVLAAAPTADAPVQVVRIAGDEGVFDWAVHESTGRVFASSAARDQVVEYDPADGHELRRIRVDGAPGEMVVKKDWLIVACRHTRAVSIIDLGTNAVVGTIPLAGRSPDAVFCSRTDHPFAYARCTPDDANAEDEVFQLDLSSRTVRHRARLRSWAKVQGGQVCMSGDGQWILVESQERPAERGRLELLSADEEAGEFLPTKTRPWSSGPGMAVPGNRAWTVGNLVLSLDLATQLANVDRVVSGTPIAVHPRLDVVAYLQPPENYDAASPAVALDVAWQALSEAKPSRTVAVGSFERPLPGAPVRPSFLPPPAPAHAPRLQFDLRGSRLVCGWGRCAAIVDCTRWEPAVPPSLQIQVPSICRAKLGEELRLRLTLSNPELLPKTQFTLASGPAGAKVHEGQFVWQPGPGDAGLHTVEVWAMHGQRRDACKFTVEVGLTKFCLGFAAAGLCLDSAGQRAVCWGPASDQPRNNPPTEFALLDLAAGKITQRSRLDFGVKFMQIDEDYLYIGPVLGNFFYWTSRNDLSRLERVLVPRPPQDVVRLGQNLLAVNLSDQGGQEVRIYQRDTLQRVMTPDFDWSQVASWGGSGPPCEVGDGLVCIGGQIIDRTSGERLCVLKNWGWRSLFYNPSGPPMVVVGPWGRSLSNSGQLQARPNREIWRQVSFASSSEGAFSALSLTKPMLAALRMTPTADRRPLYLELRDLEAAALLHTVFLGEVQSLSPGFTIPPLFVKLAANRVAVAGGLQVVATELPEDLLQRVPVPLHLKYPRVPVGNVAQTLTFRLTAAGGRGARSYSLIHEWEGLAIDRQTGVVTVDLPRLWQKYLTDFESQATSGGSNPLPLQRGGEAYEKVTGQRLPEDSLAVAASLAVAVTDEAGHQDRLDVEAVAVAPLQPLLEIQARRAEQAQAAGSTGPRAGMSGASGQGTGSAAAGSVADIAKMLSRLETALDAALKRLDHLEQRLKEKESPRGTQP